ncbi:magnesium transporter MRS2 homolog, mitochondrial isoform X1 [Brachyhypopomus gauderio]|uniref:magnesium transporter MRS2 homolog, mitochondrial isoform X1 n=1 Tax=Brachyhypopomus gauderio TaxID=698409 RepID=UPI0040413A66
MEACVRFMCREIPARWTCRSLKSSRSPLKRPLCSRGAACLWRRNHHVVGAPTLLTRPHRVSQFSRDRVTDVTHTSLSSVAPVFVVMKFAEDGSVTAFGELCYSLASRCDVAVFLVEIRGVVCLVFPSSEKKKTEFCQELGLQARDLRFQHLSSITPRNNMIIIRMESLKAVITRESLLVLDFRGLGLEKWLVLELGPQLAGDGALATYSLPFEFRAMEAILQHRINTLQTRLNEVQPQILDCLESLVDPKLLSADRSKLHMLLLNSKSLSELETDVKVFKDSLLKILDEEEFIEELCLTKWTDPRVFEESSLDIDHAYEMELLLENYFMQADELGNKAREMKGLIDDSESVIFINLDSHRNVMMRLNLQLTMGTFSLSLFGMMGVAFGMNLESSFEEDPRVFWLVTGFMFLGSGLIWRRLLSFLGRHLEPSPPPPIPPFWRKNQISTLKGSEVRGESRSKMTL